MMFPIVVPNLQSQCPGITGVDHQIELKHFKKKCFFNYQSLSFLTANIETGQAP